MKRNIFILTITLTFVVSTTGMPLIIHYCKMMETASLQACEMHTKEMQKSSCCESETQSSAIADSYYSKAIDDCCEDFVVDHSVKETFITTKTDINISLYLNTFIPVDIVFTSNHNSFIKADTYPPPLLSNKIYLTNSVLLI
jgi:hypothetical protein